MTRWLLVSFLLVGCAGSLSPARRADGGWHLKCGPALAKCTQQADDLCKGRGYVVISGFSKRKLYGAELGVSQVEERESELDIACADKRDALPNVTAAPAASVWKLPPRTDLPPEPAAPASPAPASPAPASPAPASPAPPAAAPAAPAPVSPAPAAPAPAVSPAPAPPASATPTAPAPATSAAPAAPAKTAPPSAAPSPSPH